VSYFRNLFCLCLMAIVPFGYYAGDRDSSRVRIDVGGGAGQYLAVLNSCNDIPEKRLDDFKDIGADISFRPSVRLPLVFGLRGGHLSTDPEKIVYAYFQSSTPPSFENGYINPYLSIETKYFGAGTGWVRNLGPEIPAAYFDLDLDFRQEKDFASGHIRVGAYSSVYAIVSFCEGVPIASQYGYFFLGGGGSIKRWHFAGGFSGGPYHGGGVYLGLSHDTKHYGRPSLSVRAGGSEGEFEGAINLGWSWPVF
jgi:hypothetical protein